ncbi:MAG TPA: response regulator transcription factor [Acidimicrobiales bacterium]|nr:response regulator transcription factor [Acidimicrobiales bacterium]
MSANDRAGDNVAPPDPIRVLVVEDHVLVAEGLLSLLALEPDIDLIGHVPTMADSIAAVRSDPPDVVLMDFRLPDGDGAKATEQIKAEFPEIKVVILTGTADDSVLSRAIEAGCSGYLTKDQPIEDVVMALRAAAAGEALIAPVHLSRLMAHLTQRPTTPHNLSPRELEVLQLLAYGASTDDIVARLVISPHTARNHVRNILSKMGVHSKLEAVSVAAREGIVELVPQS